MLELGARGLCALSTTCTLLREVCCSDELWRPLLERECGARRRAGELASLHAGELLAREPTLSARDELSLRQGCSCKRMCAELRLRRYLQVTM